MWTRIPSSSLKISGSDRVDFVQGQMSNDVRGAPTPGMMPCAFLNVRGQLETFARIYKRSEDLYIHLDAGQSSSLAARFKKYIIFDQVEVEEMSAQLATLHLWSESLSGWQKDGPDVQILELAGSKVLVGRVRRTGVSGLDLHYLVEQEQTILAELSSSMDSFEERTLAELDQQRIVAGIPDPIRDDFTGVLLQEIGLDVGGVLPAISYRKGCYVGQEIMARLEARGQTRYHLARLVGQELPSHTKIQHEGKIVGQSGLSVGDTCLVRIRKSLENGSKVELEEREATLQLLEPHV